MFIEFDNIFSNNIIAKSDYDACLNQNIAAMRENLNTKKVQNVFSVIQSPFETSRVESVSKKLLAKYDEFVIVGIGGSNLSGMAFYDTCNSDKKIHFIDNIDPKKISRILKSINYEKTKFIIITKSGNTQEILYITEYLLGVYKDLKPLFITENKDTRIMKIINHYDFEVMFWINNIGGRYSCFNTNSLLIAALSGIDINNILESIKPIISDIDKDAKFYETAVIKHLLAKKGYHINTMFSYSSCLSSFNSWFIQLWSESLGQYKEAMLAHGSIGSTDQHSQMQLYLGGNKNNIFNIMDVSFEEKLPMPQVNITCADTIRSIAMLNSKFSEFLSDIFNSNNIAFIRGTMQCNPNSIAQYMAYFMFEVLSIALLNNIDPFQQPHVDNSKSYLSRI